LSQVFFADITYIPVNTLENSAKTAYFKISHFGTAEKLFNYPVSLAILSQHQIARCRCYL
jgi:hypothetical protein